MKKIISMIVALVMALTLLTACSSGFTGVKEYGGEVSSNGGFAVQKGDYVYFINGKEDYTADNTFGTPQKGALVRAKLADLKNFGTMAACEMVIPKLMYTEYTDANTGVYIFGDYVYYATPSTVKNKKGEVQNTNVEFTKTKLDGTNTKVIATVSGLDTPYRFVSDAEGNVYLTVYTTVDGDNCLVTYTADGKEDHKSRAVSAYVLSDDATATYAYYEKKGYNEQLEQDESFSEVYRYALTHAEGDAAEGELVLSGAGMYSSATGIGTQGVTFTFVKLTASNLFVYETYVDTSVSTGTRYYGWALENVTTDPAATYASKVLLNDGTANASTIFASNSVYVALDTIIYNDTTYGLVRYNYTDKDNLKTFGIEHLVYNSDLMSYTYSYDDGEYMYYYGNNYYYRIKIADVIAKTDNVERMTYTATSTTSDFYRPEIIDGVLLIANTNDPMYNYVCAYDVTAAATMTDDEIEAFATSDRAHALARLNYRAGIITKEDAEKVTEYIDENYPEDSSSAN